jgi:hypothetical protein
LFVGQVGGGRPNRRVRRVSDEHGDPTSGQLAKAADGPTEGSDISPCGAEQDDRRPRLQGGQRLVDVGAHRDCLHNPGLHNPASTTLASHLTTRPWAIT